LGFVSEQASDAYAFSFYVAVSSRPPGKSKTEEEVKPRREDGAKG